MGMWLEELLACRLWFLNFSSLLHFALLLENHTWKDSFGKLSGLRQRQTKIKVTMFYYSIVYVFCRDGISCDSNPI